MRIFLTILFVFLSPLLRANADIDENTKRVILDHYENANILEFTNGYLFGGKDKYIGVVIKINGIDTEDKTKIILIQNSQIVDETKFWIDSTWLFLSFKKGSLFISYDAGSCGAVCHNSGVFQFRIVQNKLKLIGLESSSVFSDYGETSSKKSHLITKNKSINFLNNHVLHSIEYCKSSKENPWYCEGKSKYKSISFIFHSFSGLNFDIFSLDEFWQYETQEKYLKGSVDMDFKYHEL